MTLAESSDTELTGLAADGHRHAAGELLSRHLHLLTVMSRRIATPTIDPEDLLGEAIANLLTKWAQGQGPREYAEAYVIRSMRNRVADELRSPRSRVISLDPDWQPVPVESPDYDRVERHQDFEMVRDALAKLPADQRRVLLATVVDGRKPGDLVAEFERPAGAIYSLSRRAKLNLRRALLQVMLERKAPAECRAYSSQLPPSIDTDLLDQLDFAGPRHIRECGRCSAAWQLYLTQVQGAFPQ
ncbi:MAG: sigma-70 family RNA polymerase sigma factor [Propionibacteriaceae bacterium]|nr:sigma-70 family RNA polymerase sigma factor [Propionibacteriaceae bacterium]